jgi:plastocyanin
MEISVIGEKAEKEKPRTWIIFITLFLIVIAIIALFVVFKVYNQFVTTNKNLKSNLSNLDLYNIYNIDIGRTGFFPPTLEIKKGDMVIWKNQDTIPHRVVSKIGDKFDSKNLVKGQNFTIIFTNDSEIDYYDIYYPYLIGKISIENSSVFEIPF